jgi:hypothetical protein
MRKQSDEFVPDEKLSAWQALSEEESGWEGGWGVGQVGIRRIREKLKIYYFIWGDFLLTVVESTSNKVSGLLCNIQQVSLITINILMAC